MKHYRLISIVIILVSIFLAFFVYPSAFNSGADFLNSKLHLEGKKYAIPHLFHVPDFHLGLDLVGGTHLVYQADLSGIKDQSPADAMAGVRDVIERRVNLFGVAEPLVQIEGKDQLVVELAGITNINQAIQMIGQTPFLEFKEQKPGVTADQISTGINQGKSPDEFFQSTGLTGKNIQGAQVVFNQTSSNPQVSLTLNSEGAKLFADITKRNIGKLVAIYIDGVPISVPVVQSEIDSGQALISGNFTVQQAKDLANNLNAGALPVPITLISQQTIGATLGHDSLVKSLKAGLYGLLLVAIFMIIYYRLPGLIAVVALVIYTFFVLTLYKLIPVTMTLSGIAGFILSLGIAVDANVLIFARMREELKAGKTLLQSANDGFKRAWLSIRDSHVTTLLGALVLYIFTTSFVKGFALTLGIGVLMSLVTSIVITRAILMWFLTQKLQKFKWLF